MRQQITIDYNDIKYIINECIRKIITEKCGALDEKMDKLAQLITIQIREKMRENNSNFCQFIIQKEEIEKYYIYKHPQALQILVFDTIPKHALFSDKTFPKTIALNSDSVMNNNDFFVSNAISHELTHFVNSNEAGEITTLYKTNSLYVDSLIYHLRWTEITARCNQLANYLKINKNVNFENLEEITRINHIERLFNKIKNDYSLQKLLKSKSGKTILFYEKQFRKYLGKIKKVYNYFSK